MYCRLYLGTEDGLRTAHIDTGGFEVTASSLDGNAVRSLSVAPDDSDDVLVGCGLRGQGLYRTTDGGGSVETLGFDEEWVWGLARHPTEPETIYVGTEPPMVYRSTDGGDSFEALSGVADLPSRQEWSFFFEPFEAGHVHGFDIHPERPDRIVAGVEHGAIIYSADSGETWTETMVGADAHRLAVHPDDPAVVFAANGSGLYRSDDAGEEWTQLSPLAGEYVHSIVFDPDDPERLYVYAADEGPVVYRSEDGGDSWRSCGDDLPEAGAADTLAVHPERPKTLFYAGEIDGESRLFVSHDAGDSWERLGGGLPRTWRLATAADLR
ncbi:WD40/YVTN/BNR-like repeat-containing protein [Halovenus salina]|uniref:WD40/YVTN/BNR-like repeat-containing protein n=1 Tax=Halovenus salina TaxID=1510225 RepID=UPI002261006A|nr:hypothetical protein [Halovenus salina]